MISKSPIAKILKNLPLEKLSLKDLKKFNPKILNKLKKIITNMIHDKKSVGISRAVGQVFWEPNQELTRVQKDDTTDFMPQFFIAKSDLIKKKMFSKMKNIKNN